jgi:2-C-methyl-D-erythritol 2,4-cyclodiphosphate synthase
VLDTAAAAALELESRGVAVVAGHADNAKITEPADLERAAGRRSGSVPDLRVGTGFDVHRVDPGRRLVLGGVDFPDHPGLAGHSDADVVLHAAMDALLGAACLGDIGVHFPPDDPSFAGASSTVLARRVGDLVRGAGFEIVNLDLTLLAESPRIRARVGEMRRAIGEGLGVDRARVGLKATTLEGLGALGRGEGIACQAACLLRRRPIGEG